MLLLLLLLFTFFTTTNTTTISRNISLIGICIQNVISLISVGKLLFAKQGISLLIVVCLVYWVNNLLTTESDRKCCYKHVCAWDQARGWANTEAGGVKHQAALCWVSGPRFTLRFWRKSHRREHNHNTGDVTANANIVWLLSTLQEQVWGLGFCVFIQRLENVSVWACSVSLSLSLMSVLRLQHV